MSHPMYVHTRLFIPPSAYGRDGDDPVVLAARESTEAKPSMKMVRNIKRDRMSGQKGAASRMAMRFAQKLAVMVFGFWLLVLVAEPVLAACTTQTVILPDGSVKIYSICCDAGGNCTVVAY